MLSLVNLKLFLYQIKLNQTNTILSFPVYCFVFPRNMTMSGMSKQVFSVQNQKPKNSEDSYCYFLGNFRPVRTVLDSHWENVSSPQFVSGRGNYFFLSWDMGSRRFWSGIQACSFPKHTSTPITAGFSLTLRKIINA